MDITGTYLIHCTHMLTMLQNVSYNTVGGNMMRALGVVESYLHFSGKKTLEAEELRSVCTLGWCAELVCIHALRW